MMKRILIVNVNWLGDILFTTPAMRAIRKSYPGSFIGCMLPERCAPLVKDNPNIDDIIIFEEKSIHKSILSKLKFVNYLRSKNFDTAFMFHRSLTRLLIVYLAGIKRRIGYERLKTSFLLTDSIPAQDKDSMHRIDYFLNIVKGFCNDVEDKSIELHVAEEDFEFIDRLLYAEGIKKDDFLIIINPGANWSLKRWPAENFARLSDIFIKDFHAKIIITGSDSSKDLELANNITNLMQEKANNFAGRTNLGQLAALMKRANLVISADSGPLHIAIALRKKTISIFGPTSVDITGPLDTVNNAVLQRNIGCKIPCYNLACQDNRCMKAVSVEDIISVVKTSKII